MGQAVGAAAHVEALEARIVELVVAAGGGAAPAAGRRRPPGSSLEAVLGERVVHDLAAGAAEALAGRGDEAAVGARRRYRACNRGAHRPPP